MGEWIQLNTMNDLTLAIAGGGGSLGGGETGGNGSVFLLVLYLFLALGVSFLCSILEAALLTLPRSHIGVMHQRGIPAARALQDMKDNIDRPLSAILTLNTIAHTVGAAGVGAQSQMIFGDKWVTVTSAVLTFLILVLSEIAPKTLGAVYAKPLARFVAWVVRAMVVGIYPLVRLCEVVSYVIGGGKTEVMTRADVVSVAEIGAKDGALASEEANTIRNLLHLRNIRVFDIMTPRSVTLMFQAEAPIRDVVDPSEPLRFSRIPVYRNGPDDLIGVVYRYDLMEAYRQGRLDQQVHQLMRPLQPIPESAKASSALRRFIEKKSHIFQVVDEYGGTAGILTMEDVLESLLGVEIVDETDPVTDMQELALRRRAMPGVVSRDMEN